MRVSDTTRMINRIFNYYSSLGIDYRAIVELEIKNSHGNTKLDFIIFLNQTNPEYFVFELKYNRKNIQDLSNIPANELPKTYELIQRVQDQYQKITNIQNTDWDSIQFPQPLGQFYVIYCYINSLFINEFLTVIRFNHSKDSYFSIDKQNRGYIRGSFENIHFPNAENLISFIIINEEKLIIPFSFSDLDFKSNDEIPFTEVSRNQGRLLLNISKSFLRERISTLEKTFIINDFYDEIFGEIEDRFSFGKVDKKNIIKVLKKYCNLLSEIVYYKDRKVLNIDGDIYKINIRNSRSRDKVLDKVEKLIQEKIAIKTLDDWVNPE